DRILGYTNYKISNRFIMTLILDITEKERLESIAAAINTMNNIGYIFSGIRHEIGNPLNSIKMTTSVLKLKIDSFSKETVLSYIDRIQKETSRIEYLLLSLKSFNVYENPKMEKVDIFLFLKKFISLASTDIKKNNITLNLKSYSKDNHGITDPRALHQVLINLVTNAVDSLKEKEKPEIVLSIRRKKEHLVLSVIDNGCGIPHDSQKELFKPFFTNKPEGTGLGLVIVKKLLAKMNSTIHIQSCEKIGTTVIINIPIKHNELVAQEKYITDTC
ncbi:MAG: HAMP domain-containing histidine kinase, partial [Calditrichia bacterium]|nr:HAMP domain-containing histidine kinase [Calditrichia bacterium]